MKSPKECQNIEDVRNAIDQLDTNIIELLGKRFQYVKEIVKYKPTDKKSIVALPRLNAVISSRRELASQNGLSPDVIENVYRMLIDYFIAEEEKLITPIK